MKWMILGVYLVGMPILVKWALKGLQGLPSTSQKALYLRAKGIKKTVLGNLGLIMIPFFLLFLAETNFVLFLLPLVPLLAIEISLLPKPIMSITQDQLHIRRGYLPDRKIDIKDIDKIVLQEPDYAGMSRLCIFFHPSKMKPYKKTFNYRAVDLLDDMAFFFRENNLEYSSEPQEIRWFSK